MPGRDHKREGGASRLLLFCGPPGTSSDQGSAPNPAAFGRSPEGDFSIDASRLFLFCGPPGTSFGQGSAPNPAAFGRSPEGDFPLVAIFAAFRASSFVG